MDPCRWNSGPSGKGKDVRWSTSGGSRHHSVMFNGADVHSHQKPGAHSFPCFLLGNRVLICSAAGVGRHTYIYIYYHIIKLWLSPTWVEHPFTTMDSWMPFGSFSFPDFGRCSYEYRAPFPRYIVEPLMDGYVFLFFFFPSPNLLLTMGLSLNLGNAHMSFPFP